jgi:hypothetical protein
MAAVDNIVRGFAEGVIKGIQNNIRTKKVTEYGAMNNTGQMANSLGYTWDGKTLIIYSSEKYFTVLEDGRKPGKQPPSDPIEEWVKQRGLDNDISAKSLAYLIARKIGREGSLLYKQGGNSGIISDYLNEAYIEENLTKKLFLETVETITNVLTEDG